MIVYHLVLFKAKQNIDVAKLQRMHEGFNNMEPHIPVVIKSAFGENKTHRGKGYTHALLVELKSFEGLETYLNHPHHIALVAANKECVDTDVTLVVDYEV